MQCLSKDNMESMSHTQPSIEHHPSVKGLFDYIPDPITLPCQADLSSSSSDFMTAPVMKTTASCDSLNNMLPSGPLNYFAGPFSAPAVNTTTAMIPAMSAADIDWTAKASSFISTTEDTPSVSSSFDFMDIRKEDSPVYQCLPFYPQDESSHAVKPIALQAHAPHFNYPLLPLGNNDTPWGICSATSDPDSWHQPYVSDNIADEQAWASAEYFPTSWAGTESTPNTVFINSPSMHPYEPYQQIPLPMDQHPNPNPILRHPSTPIPSDSDTEHPNIIPQPLEAINHAYQGYRDLHTPVLPSPTDLTHTQPPIPHPPTRQPDPEPVSIKASLHYSDSRNAFLIDCKQRGLSYKDIKRMGGFKEAESTLRGRFRTLTKTKEQRVRKPKWLDRDVSYLPGLHTHVSIQFSKFSCPCESRDEPG